LTLQARLLRFASFSGARACRIAMQVLTPLRRGIAEEAARAYDAAARAIRGPNARTNFAYDETQPQPVRTLRGPALDAPSAASHVVPSRQVIEFPTQPGQACVVHLPPLPGKPVPAAAAAPVGGTSRQQQMHQNQAQAAMARGATGRGGAAAAAAPPAPAVAPGGGIAIPARPAEDSDMLGSGAVAEARRAMMAAAGGGLSFKSSYGSLMDATGLTVYMEERMAGESPLMHTFAVPGSEGGGQAVSFPRSLGPLRDVMDLGSPAWADGR